MTTTPTFDRDTWHRAMDAWAAGGFSPEWADWRLLAARAGVIFPPSGTAEDSWADARPSQRALVVRAMRETPRLLRWAIARPGVRSWGDVLEHLLSARDELALDAEAREREWRAVKRGEPPARLRDVLATIGDSLGGPR